jgi:hypothetical protein
MDGRTIAVLDRTNAEFVVLASTRMHLRNFLVLRTEALHRTASLSSGDYTVD